MTVAQRNVHAGRTPVLLVRPRSDFIETGTTHEVTRRALTYLEAGFPVHFRGPAGTGKTTLALHVAAQLGRPVMLIVGDEEFSTKDLVGGQFGYRYRKVVDRFIHTVTKYEEDAVQRWADNRLTTACREGFTLVYDEFTRSRPETNNVLLTVLEERLLVLPSQNRENAYIKVHPEFRAIFTSNPQEYAGVHEAQDALSDRLVTIDLDYYDRTTEIAITAARSELSQVEAAKIVDVVRDFRASGEYDQTPTLRACIMIAKVTAMQDLNPSANDPRFVSVCLDILESKSAFISRSQEHRIQQRKMLLSLIEHHCGQDANARQSTPAQGEEPSANRKEDDQSEEEGHPRHAGHSDQPGAEQPVSAEDARAGSDGTGAPGAREVPSGTRADHVDRQSEADGDATPESEGASQPLAEDRISAGG